MLKMKCPFCHKEVKLYCPKCKKRVDNYCPFCDLKGLKPRTFYDENNWIGFLAAPYHTEGHTILAARPKNKDSCLTELDDNHWKGLGISIKKVSKAIMECYKPKDVLFASLRGDSKHFHLHLIPLEKKREKSWRKEKLYGKGHLFEFLGDLEKDGDTKALRERIQQGWDEDKQRKVITKKLKSKVKQLKIVINCQKS